MTKATRAGSKLDQLLGRSPTAGLSVSSGHPDAKYLRGGTIADALTPPAYTITARVLHWITAFLILSIIPIGVVIANEWGGSAQDSLYDLHRSIGAAVIPLVFLRLIYRWAHLPLPLPEDIPAMQRLTAHVQEITCPDSFVSISNSTAPLRSLFQQHRSHFRREVGKTASPHEQTYPAVIGSSGKCQ